MRPVYFAPDPLDAHLVERLLAGEGIRAVVRGDYLFGVRGGIPITAATGQSYEDPDIAKLLNEEFVCIKVDRDERPDVDARYQRAVQALTGQGGWPLTAFLDPQGEVFFGGTYFPPEPNPFGRPGFASVLR